MKKNLIVSLLAVAAMVGFTACGGDDPAPAPGPDPGPVTDITLNAISGLGSYSIKERTNENETGLFQVSLFSVPATGTSSEPTIEVAPASYLVLALCNDIADMNNPSLPAGTYTVSTVQETRKNVCVGGESSAYVTTNADGIAEMMMTVKSGKVEVAVSGNIYKITATLLLADPDNILNDKTITANYTGRIEFADMPYSTLQKDLTAKVSDFTGKLRYFGKTIAQEYPTGEGVAWQILLEKPEEQQLTAWLVMPEEGVSFETGLPAGEYKVDWISNYKTGNKTCFTGGININPNGATIQERLLYTWSWLLTDEAYVPFSGGRVIVSRDGDKYTIDCKVIDDKLHPSILTAVWTGTPQMIDESKTTSSMPMSVVAGK